MTTNYESRVSKGPAGLPLHTGIFICISAQLLACGNELVAWPSADIIAPTVTSTVPLDGATGVAINAAVSAVFSEPMDPLTISEASFTLFDGTSPVPGTVSYVGVTATFDPAASLDAATTYTARVRDTAGDLAGNTLVADYTWSFRTGLAPDIERPIVTLTIPADGAVDAELDANLLAVFSEAMDPASIDSATFTLMRGASPISGVVTSMGATAMFDPSAPLALDAEYTATITTAASDLAGNTLAASYVWTFTTVLPVDPGTPTVILTSPEHLATNVSLGATVSATFSETMDPLTTSAASFGVTGPGGAPISGMVVYDVPSQTLTLTPLSPFFPNTTYTATVTTGATDLSGTPLAADYVWTFTTALPVDPGTPTVILTSPEHLATNVSFGATVSATFSEAMDPLTTSAASFGVTGPGGAAISGMVVYDVPSQTLTLTPMSPFFADTTYTATVTTGATDLSGTPLAADYVWTFTTALPVDPGTPRVILTSPENLATDVPVGATVKATFNEAMDPLTTSAASFGVTGPGGAAISGMVVYDVPTQTLTLTPMSPFLPDTTYTATVTTGATDLSGTPLAADYVWTFSTRAFPPGMAPVDLGSLTTFVAVAGAGLTNSNSSGITTLGGDVGLFPTATCLGDGSPCTLFNPLITGTLYAADPAGVAAQAKVDLTAAYIDATSRPPGTTVNDISGMVLAPGVYTSGSTMSIAVGGTVTLDGGGDANAVWIFQIGSSLTVNNNAQVLLINGAQARNVFWAAFASSTLGSNVSFQGSVLAGESNSVGTDSVVVGRLLCTTGQITLLSNTITLPL